MDILQVNYLDGFMKRKPDKMCSSDFIITVLINIITQMSASVRRSAQTFVEIPWNDQEHLLNQFNHYQILIFNSQRGFSVVGAAPNSLVAIICLT